MAILKPTQREASRPLVSCIMVTSGRLALALNAIRLFRAQSYPARQLVIVESGESSLAYLSDSVGIRYDCVGGHETIGTLRNHACELARGEIIVQWDDDDWHGPHRLSRQVSAIRCGVADVTALRDVVMFDVTRWEFWRVTRSLHRRMWALDANGGTLAFRRCVWERVGGYPSSSLAEDAQLLVRAVAVGSRLRLMDGEGAYLYVRHGRNTFKVTPGVTGGRRHWVRTVEPQMTATDHAFFARLQATAVGIAATSDAREPGNLIDHLHPARHPLGQPQNPGPSREASTSGHSDQGQSSPAADSCLPPRSSASRGAG
jgi:O-antigen biosynthesis protein